MKTHILCTRLLKGILLLTLPLTSLFTQAATVEVVWTEPDNYRDIYPGEESRKRFRERTFASFDKHFNKLAEKLPADQILKINMLDVDLAGDTHIGGIKRIRIIKDLYFPRLKFSYQLFDAKNKELNSGEINLKDMSFMSGVRLRYRNESLGYEKNMLDEWFDETFLSQK